MTLGSHSCAVAIVSVSLCAVLGWSRSSVMEPREHRKMGIERTALLRRSRKILLLPGSLQYPRGSSCLYDQEMCFLNNAQASPS